MPRFLAQPKRFVFMAVVLFAVFVSVSRANYDGFDNDDDDDFEFRVDSLRLFQQRRDYAPPAPSKGWPQWGRDWYNSHYQPREKKINPVNVNQLQLRCSYNLTRAPWGQPTTAGDNYLYFTAQDGLLYAINRRTCATLWSYNVTAFLTSGQVSIPSVNNIVSKDSRSSPAIYGRFLFIGTRAGAYLLKFDRFTGQKIWHVRVDTHILAQLTQSPVVDPYGRVLIGVSSQEVYGTQLLAGPPFNYRCCSFQGSMNAFSADDGRLLWRTLMLPDNGGQNGGFAGAAVWGSAPSMDLERGLVYIGTSQLYIGPPDVEICRNLTSRNTTLTANNGTQYVLDNHNQRDPCRLESVNGKCGDCSSSIIALRLSDGWVEWSSAKQDVDSYIVPCGLFLPPNFNIPRNLALCPQTPGPDYDFAQAPIFIPSRYNTPGRSATVYAGQKSGVVWATNAHSGQTFWGIGAAVGGKLGGMQWGSASDGERFYYTASNSQLENVTITYQGQNISINYAHFGAMNVTNGEILWQTPSLARGAGQGTIAVANGVVFYGDRNANATMYALDARNGNILWQVNAGGTSAAMATVLPGDGTLILVGGYQSTPGFVSIYTLP